ncbi:MAG: MBL fold metallo-hydrolase [Prevotellaceae bacterium]|nr:MBL fold metallo-hydrolase [Prevotellaceae bacterium]MDY3856150.1 MBL fold metallo-hydrolase [Bacteroidaceae bacterium]
MLTVKRFLVNMIRENTYIISDETGEALILDPGMMWEEEQAAVKAYIADHQLKPVRQLCTHAHFDHIMGSYWVWETYGLKCDLSEGDTWLYDHLEDQVEEILGQRYSGLQLAPSGLLLSEHEEVRVGHHTLTVICTPGHTQGGVCYYCEAERMMWSGDTLFRGSYGRTDLRGGDPQAMAESLRTLSKLPPETMVYPGHGAETSIGDELPWLDRSGT